MRLLLDCRMASWSGVGRYATGLARALAARGDIELVQVCAVGEPPPVAPGPGAEVVAASRHPFGVRGALELGRLARQATPHIVHCPHFPTPAPVRGPLVVTLHDLTPLVVPGVMPSAARRAVYRAWNARAARLAGRIIVPSRATATDVSRLFAAARGKLAVTAEAADDFSSGPSGPLTGTLARLAVAAVSALDGQHKGRTRTCPPCCAHSRKRRRRGPASACCWLAPSLPGTWARRSGACRRVRTPAWPSPVG